MLYQVGAYQDRDLYLKKSLKTVEEMESWILKILEVSRMEKTDRKAERDPQAGTFSDPPGEL